MKKLLLSGLAACSLWSARATLFQYTVLLDGANESPVNTSPGIGFGTVNYDDVLHTLQLEVTFSGLTNVGSGTTASHIHAATTSPFTGTAGVATTTPSFAGFPIGVFSGTFSNTLDMTQASSYNPTYVSNNGGTTASAELALAAAMAAGKAYWNIHSQAFPGGEIRGFLVPVPEPSSVAIAGVFAAAGCVVRRIRTGKARANKS